MNLANSRGISDTGLLNTQGSQQQLQKCLGGEDGPVCLIFFDKTRCFLAGADCPLYTGCGGWLGERQLFPLICCVVPKSDTPTMSHRCQASKPLEHGLGMELS